MKAGIFYGPNNIKIEDIQFPSVLNDIIPLKVLSCSVCSYDVRTFRNGHFKVKPPMTLGHEICAETINRFEGNNFSIRSGERVSIYPVIPCFNCWYCNHKKYNLCSNLKEIGSSVNGGFAQFIFIPKQIFEIGGVVPVLKNITNEEASLIEPLACCINSINQIKSLDFESIIILGDGPIGLMQVMLLKLYFPELPLIVIGMVKHRLEMAKRLGADEIYKIDYRNDISKVKEFILRFHSVNSPNLIFISNSNNISLKMAYVLANKNGKIVIFSGVKNNNYKSNDYDLNRDLEANIIHYNHLSVFGSFSSTPDNFIEGMELVNSGKLKLKNLVTHKFNLSNLEEALKTAERFEGIKSIINNFNNL